MRRMTMQIAFCLALLATATLAKDIPERAPGPKTKGKHLRWKAKDGLVYHYWVPKKYDPKAGANLTLILHGSGMSERWGFANNTPPGFRGDDIVVSPEGTTVVRGNGEFLGTPKDAKRVRALQKELEKIFKINATFLYGHSQGSFFSIYYAGQFPAHVQGVVAHASGYWARSKVGKKGHHQAIVFMHGTQDPVVRYFQSVGGYRGFKKAGYPMVRLCSLENWNHWPAEHNGPIRHTSQQLAWCEGMTTGNAERLKWCFEFIANCKKKDRTDYNALYTLSKRVVELPFAPDGIRRRAAKAIDVIEALAKEHIKKLPPAGAKKLERGAWNIHLLLVLRNFADTDACKALQEAWQKTLDKHEKLAGVQVGKYYSSKKPAAAFAAWTKAVQVGFLYFRCYDNEILKRLKEWRGDAKKNKISKKAKKEYDALIPPIAKASIEAYKTFDAINRKRRKF